MLGVARLQHVAPRDLPAGVRDGDPHRVAGPEDADRLELAGEVPVQVRRIERQLVNRH